MHAMGKRYQDTGFAGDARWLRDLNEKLEERGKAAELARQLGVRQSAITRLRRGEAGSLALVLAVSTKLKIDPPAGLGIAKAKDDLEERWIAVLRRLVAAGAHVQTDDAEGPSQIEAMIRRYEAIADDMEKAEALRRQADEARERAMKRLRDDDKPKN